MSCGLLTESFLPVGMCGPRGSRLRGLTLLWYLILAPGVVSGLSSAKSSHPAIRVDVRKTLDRLLEQEDTDGDHKITVHDLPVPGTGRGSKRFSILTIDSLRYEVAGTYFLSNLLEELKLAEDSTAVELVEGRIFE